MRAVSFFATCPQENSDLVFLARWAAWCFAHLHQDVSSRKAYSLLTYLRPLYLAQCKRGKSLIPYQRSQIYRLAQSSPDQILNHNRRFNHVYLDILAPSPPSHCHHFLLTRVDPFHSLAIGCPHYWRIQWASFRNFSPSVDFYVLSEGTIGRGARFQSKLFTDIFHSIWI